MKYTFLLIFVFIVLQSCNWNNGQEGYEGDLIPIKAEVSKIDDYEKAARLILKYKSQTDTQPEVHYPRQTPELFVPRTLKDSIFTYVKDTLNLRFFFCDVKIEGKDTVVLFRPEPGDHYMRGNKKDEDACCTLFKHDIIYSTKQIEEFEEKDYANDTPTTIIKLKHRMYYRIYSRLEY